MKAKLLYLPNENQLGDQVGPRAAFEGMLACGELMGYEVVSFQIAHRETGSISEMQRRIVETAQRLQPDIILWQHPGHLEIETQLFHDLKRMPSKPTVVYDERDVYGEGKPLPYGARVLAREADLVFIVGLGEYRELLLRHGAREVRYTCSCVDTKRFGTEWIPTDEREYDAVMIGNLVGAGRWGRGGLPGWKNRQQLAQRLHKTLGKRFAVFGNGWAGLPCCRGELPFERQEKINRQAWLSVGWDHFDQVPFFFSNRTPIAMQSGVVHLKNYHPGYEAFFGTGNGIYWGQTVDEVVDVCLYLLSCPRQRLIEWGGNAKTFARTHLRFDIEMRKIISLVMEWRNRLT